MVQWAKVKISLAVGESPVLSQASRFAIESQGAFVSDGLNFKCVRKMLPLA